jgi:hypothetical protein
MLHRYKVKLDPFKHAVYRKITNIMKDIIESFSRHNDINIRAIIRIV